MSALRILDFSGMAFTLLSIYFTGKKSWIGWMFNIVVSAVYFTLGLINNMPFMAALNVICFGMAIFNMIKWIREDKVKVNG